MLYVNYDSENGKINGYYDSDIHFTVGTKLVPKLTKDLQNVILLETYKEEIKTPTVDENNETILDENGNIVYNITYKTVNKLSPRYDENGIEIKYDLNKVVTIKKSVRIPNIPMPYIEITEEQHKEALRNNYNYVDDKTNTLSKREFRNIDTLINITLRRITELADYWSIEINNYVSNKKLTNTQFKRYEYKYETALECKNKDNYDVFKAEAANTGLEPNKLADIIIEYHDKWLNTIKLNSMRIEYFRVAIEKQIYAIKTIADNKLVNYKIKYAKDNFSLKTTDDEVTALINLDKIPN